MGIEPNRIPSVCDASPWGSIQHVAMVGEGIAHVMTAGHGGLRLWGRRYEMFRDLVPEFEPWSGKRNFGWFEEDCDWAAVVLFWPEAFREHVAASAKIIAKAQAASQDGGPYRAGWRAAVKAAEARRQRCSAAAISRDSSGSAVAV
jgi:hypothetical protein